MANFLNQRRQPVSQILVQNQQSLEDLQQRVQNIDRLCSDQEVKDFGDPKTASELDRQVREHNELKQQLEDQTRTLETYTRKTAERCETLEGIDRFDPAAMRERIESLDKCDADRLLKGYAEHIIADKVASLNTDNVENVLDIPVLNDMALTSDQRLLISRLFESFRTSVSQKYEEQNQAYKKTSEDQSRRLTELTENRDRVELENTRLTAANKRLEASQEAWKKAKLSLAEAQEHTKKAQAAQRIAEENLDERSSQLKECENKFQALEQQRGSCEAEKLQLHCEIDNLNTQLANARDYQEADQELQNQAALLEKTQKDAQNCLLKASSAEHERVIAELRVNSIEGQLQFEKVRSQSLENDMQTYRERYGDDQKEIQRLLRDLDDARSKLEDNCSRQRESLDREAGIKEELRQSQRETRRLGQQVDRLKADVEEHQRVNNELKQQAVEHEQAHAASMEKIRQLNIEKGGIETELQQSHQNSQQLREEGRQREADSSVKLSDAAASVQSKQREVDGLNDRLTSLRQRWAEVLTVASTHSPGTDVWKDLVSQVEHSTSVFTSNPKMKVWTINLHANIQQCKSTFQCIVDLYAAFHSGCWTMSQAVQDICILSMSLAEQSVTHDGLLRALVRIAVSQVCGLEARSYSIEQFAIAFGVSQMVHVIKSRWPGTHTNVDESQQTLDILEKIFPHGHLREVMRASNAENFTRLLGEAGHCLIRGRLAIIANPNTDFVLVFNVEAYRLSIIHKTRCSLQHLGTVNIGDATNGGAFEVDIGGQLSWFIDNVLIA